MNMESINGGGRGVGELPTIESPTPIPPATPEINLSGEVLEGADIQDKLSGNFELAQNEISIDSPIPEPESESEQEIVPNSNVDEEERMRVLREELAGIDRVNEGALDVASSIQNPEGDVAEASVYERQFRSVTTSSGGGGGNGGEAARFTQNIDGPASFREVFGKGIFMLINLFRPSKWKEFIRRNLSTQNNRATQSGRSGGGGGSKKIVEENIRSVKYQPRGNPSNPGFKNEFQNGIGDKNNSEPFRPI